MHCPCRSARRAELILVPAASHPLSFELRSFFIFFHSRIRAGIRPTYRDSYGRLVLGDIIVGIDGQRIAGMKDLYKVLDDAKASLAGGMLQAKLSAGQALTAPASAGGADGPGGSPAGRQRRSLQGHTGRPWIHSQAIRPEGRHRMTPCRWI